MNRLALISTVAVSAFMYLSCNPEKNSEVYDLSGEDIISLDISGVSNAEKMLLTKDGQYAVVNTDSNRGPVFVSFNSFDNNDIGMTVFFDDDNLPQFATFGGNTLIFGNVTADAIDFVLTNEKGEEVFFWDTPFLEDISGLFSPLRMTKVTNDDFNSIIGNPPAEELAWLRYFIEVANITISTGTSAILDIGTFGLDNILSYLIGKDIRAYLESKVGEKNLKELEYKYYHYLSFAPGMTPLELKAMLIKLDQWAEEKYEEKIAIAYDLTDEFNKFKDYHIKLSPGDSFSSGTSSQINITCGPEYGWYYVNVDTKSSWRVEYDPSDFYQAGKVIGGKQAFVEVYKNDSPGRRFGVVQIMTDGNASEFSGVITVTQLPNDNYFKLSDYTIFVPKEGGTYKVNVIEKSEDVEFWYFWGEPEWCNVKKKEDDSGLTIKVNEYDETRDSEAAICVSAASKNHKRPDYSASIRIIQETGQNKDLGDKLIQLYRDTDGQNWFHNDNWCSEKPISEWYGVSFINTDSGDSFAVLKLDSNNLSGHASLIDCEELRYLHLANNQLSALDVSGCSNLYSLTCDNNYITDLHADGTEAMEYLYCSNNQLTTLGLKDSHILKRIICDNNKIDSFSIDCPGALKDLLCNYNNLKTINLNGYSSLERFSAGYNPLEFLDISDCSSIEGLTLTTTEKLHTLIASRCSSLRELYCDNGNLSNLEISGCSSLTKLSVPRNKLTNISFEGCSSLEHIACSNNQIALLDVSPCPALKTLSCGYNRLTNIDVSSNQKLESLTISYNSLTRLSVKGCKSLSSLVVGNNHITSVDLSDCDNIETLSLEYNDIQTLSVAEKSLLKHLWCFNSALSSLDVSNCPSLEQLWIYDSPLTYLQMSNCPNLSDFRCRNIQLTREVPSWFTQLEVFDHDPKYTYYTSDGEKYYYVHDWGWYYPGEPEKGYHGR